MVRHEVKAWLRAGDSQSYNDAVRGLAGIPDQEIPHGRFHRKP